jgi:hypothetical protein
VVNWEKKKKVEEKNDWKTGNVLKKGTCLPGTPSLKRAPLSIH